MEKKYYCIVDITTKYDGFEFGAKTVGTLYKGETPQEFAERLIETEKKDRGESEGFDYEVSSAFEITHEEYLILNKFI